MPELPEVETVCRGLAKALTGARIAEMDQHRADLRMALPKNMPARLKGRRVTDIRRRAKYIVMTLDDGHALLLHLGMSGRMVLAVNDKTPVGKHDHLVFRFDNGVTLRFNDPRRFGMCDLVPANDIETHKLIRHIGIEPLGEDLSADTLAALLKGKKTSIKAALLDQRLVAGIGNIYASEALYYAGVSPKRLAGKCTRDQIAKLVPAIKKVLNAAIAAGGSSLRDFVQADGELGYFQHQFAVYGREGETCPDGRCGPKCRGIKRIAQGGRSTFYCPTKQT